MKSESINLAKKKQDSETVYIDKNEDWKAFMRQNRNETEIDSTYKKETPDKLVNYKEAKK